MVIWYHDDKIVKNTENIQIKITDTRTTLTIKRVTKEDEGVYTCKANSNLGEVKNKAKLYVKSNTYHYKNGICIILVKIIIL